MAGNVRLEELHRPQGVDRWHPFGAWAEDHAGFTQRWWIGPVWRGGNVRRYFALVNDVAGQIARIHLDLDFEIYRYPTAAYASPVTQVQFIEVRDDLRGRGLGPLIIDLVLQEVPGTRFVALSSADGFWESIGWTRHRHEEEEEGRPPFWPLYLSP